MGMSHSKGLSSALQKVRFDLIFLDVIQYITIKKKKKNFPTAAGAGY